MGMTEFKAVIGIWLLAQIFVIPFIIVDKYSSIQDGLIIDFGALVLLIAMFFFFFGLKLIGV